jgi:lipopolysaccharide/colanic/teichoic acid biosynthesis glycosyltransferase
VNVHRLLKRTLDLAIALSVAVLVSPLLLVIALLVKLDSKGPVLFVQDRLGLAGSVFQMYKFRTMVRNAEQMGTGLFSYEDDPRVTRVGRILRQTSLDELPQVVNVIKGDMSIVGPRPPVTYELGNYADFPRELKHRFTVKPGITGLAQLSGRNDLDWDGKLVFDTKYIRKYNSYGVAYDLYLIVRTVWVVLSMRNVIEKPSNQK